MKASFIVFVLLFCLTQLDCTAIAQQVFLSGVYGAAGSGSTGAVSLDWTIGGLTADHQSPSQPNTPSLSFNPNAINNVTTIQGNPSIAVPVTVSASGFPAGTDVYVDVQVPNGVAFSRSGPNAGFGDFTNFVLEVDDNGNFSRTLYVRLTGQAVGAINGSIGFTVGSLNISTNLPISGVVNPTNSGMPLVLLAPTYNCQTGAFIFNTVGGNGTTIEFMAIGITGWTTNPSQLVDTDLRTAADAQPITLRARQNGTESTYSWDIRTHCQQPAGSPPVLNGSLSNQYAQQNVHFGSYLPTDTFTDPEGQPLVLTATGLPNGVVFDGPHGHFSGTPTQAGTFVVTVTATDPTSLSVSGQFTMFVEPSAGGSSLALIAPLYNCQSGAFTFQTTGGDGSPIEFYAVPGITGWTTNPNHFVDLEMRTAADAPIITLRARQHGQEVTLMWNIRAVCSAGPNSPPVYHGLLTNQVAQQGTSFMYGIPATTFTDPEGQPLTYSATGLPTGINLAGTSLSGTPTQTGSFAITIKATDLSGLSAEGSFTLTVNPNNGPDPGNSLQLIAPEYNCQTGAFTFRTTGGNGTSIEFMAIGITGWTSNPNQLVDQELRTAADAQPILLRARQSGVELTYLWNIRAVCPVSNARLAATEEPGSIWTATSYPNPVDDEVVVSLSGSTEKTVQLELTDLTGNIVVKRMVTIRVPKQEERLSMSHLPSGLYLVRMSTIHQSPLVLKIIKR